MREPSYIASVLDDAAAVGDHEALRALCGRWGARAMRLRLRRGCTTLAVIWQQAAAAAEYRAFAVNHRLHGRIANALENERSSEGLLLCMAQHATRGAL